MDKRSIRSRILSLKEKIDSKTKADYDRKIFENLLSQEEFKRAKSLMIYMSFGQEVDTNPIIKYCWKEGKTVTIPVTFKENRLIKPSIIRSFDDLELSNYNILAPREDKLDFIPKEKLDLVIVPGVAFDLSGYRIGYGGGYYDRFLEGMKLDKLALLYEEQIINQVPKNKYDLPVDKLITNERIIII